MVVDVNGMTACLLPGHPTEGCTDEKRVEPSLEVPVMVGHVLVSDLVRRQLEIKECSRVQIKNVQDSWKMSFVDDIKIVIQPLNYDKKTHYKHLLTSFREWIKEVSDVSKFGGILVNKQIVSLKDNSAHLDVRTVCSELSVVRHKYHDIGMQLSIPHYKLVNFQKEEDPLQASMAYWLSGHVGGVPRVWKSVVAALQSQSVGEGELAKSLSAKYCQKDEWVNCQLTVTTRKLVPNAVARITYCLLTPADCERKRITLVVDSVSNRNLVNFRRHQLRDGGAGKREESATGDSTPKLPDVGGLNLQAFTATPKDYGAFTALLKEGIACLNTVFTGPRRCGTLLVCGMSGSAGAGCGKSSLVHLLAREACGAPYHAFVRVEDCTFLRNQTTSRTKKRLLSLFSEAIQNAPSVLVLEDLDHAMPHVTDAQEQVGEEGNNSVNKTQVFRDMLYMARSREAQVLVVATARNKQQLNRELLTSQGRHTFDKVLEIQPPTLIDRKEIVQAILHRKKIPPFTDSELRAVAARTEGFQAGDLVTLIERAVSHSELRVLCPVNRTPFDTPPSYQCQRVSIESGSDMSTSLELSSSPQKPVQPPFTPPTKHLEHFPTQLDSGISSPMMQVKRISVVSASELTPTTPRSRSLERMGVAPMVRVGSLSSMVLTVQDFVTALEGFVPVSLRGLPLHMSGSVNFSHVGGLERTKQALKETLLWPTKYPKLFSQCTIKQRCGVLLYGAPGTGKTLLAGAVAKEFGLNFVSVKGPELLNKYIGASEKAVRDIFTRAQSARPCILFFDEFDSLAPRRGHDNTGVTDRVVNQLLTQLDGVEALQGVYVLAASSRPDLIDPALLRPGRIDVKLFCNMPDENDRYEILRALSKDIKTSIDVNLKELAQSSHTEHFTGADLKALLYNSQLTAAHMVLDERQQGTSAESSVPPISPVTSVDMSMRFPGGGAGGGAKVFRYEQSEVKQLDVVPDEIKLKVALLQRHRKNTGSRPGTRDNSNISSSTGSAEVPATTRHSPSPEVLVTQDILLRAVQEVRPSVSEVERLKYSRIYDSFTGKAKKPSIVDLQQQMVTHA